mgnify:FL=1
MTQEERIQLYEMLLRRAAFSLQDYAAETIGIILMGDINDSLAMEIYKALEDKP